MKNIMNRFTAFLDKHSVHSLTVLRVFLGIVFLYFGWSSFTSPDTWTSLVPEWTNALISAETLVRIHGVIEIAFALMLILNIGARYIAFILFVDLVHVLTLLDFGGSTWTRDFGLAGALLSLALATPKNSQNLQNTKIQSV